MRVLVTGATGFVGSHLCGALDDAGHAVTAMTRRPEDYTGRGHPIGADVDDPASLAAALEGQDAAYYLIHSLDRADFVERDRDGAAAFADCAARAGVQQVIYLGGLGEEGDDLSPHLRSRREVESVLRDRVPTTVLRAGIVIGDGGISWEILCQLIERLPVMVTPRWVQTRCQPVALADALAFLIGVLGRADAVGETFEIGAPEALTYRAMLDTVADLSHHRRLIVPVPVLSPGLSSHWLRLITDVDLATARALVDSMTNEVVVRDDRINALVGHRPMPFRAAAEVALAARRARRADAAGT
ncbi:MAG: NAD(P)H-binding protein [Acidimicrobiales bacterium]